MRAASAAGGRTQAGFSLISRRPAYPYLWLPHRAGCPGFPAVPLPYPGDSDVRAGFAASPQPPVGGTETASTLPGADGPITQGDVRACRLRPVATPSQKLPRRAIR
jgi:hypothetical protein